MFSGTKIQSLLGFAAQLISPDPWHSTYGNVNQWCGKAYEPGDPAIPPTGWLDPPVRSMVPLLDLKVSQRYSPYLEEDAEGVLVIDTSLSYIHGQAWPSSSSSVDTARRELSVTNATASSNKANLAVTITRADTGRLIARTNAPVNVSDTQVPFQWGDLAPSLTSYALAVAATGPNGHTYTTKTSLQRLPSRTDGGSVFKIDNLYGGLLVQEKGSKNWTPLFPFSFYFGSGLLEPKTTEVLTDWVNMGYNILHIIPPYDYNDYKKYAEEAEKLGLWLMYDMRHTFNNHVELVKQIEMFKGFSNMLLWYTSDEPDGTQQPLESTKNSYDTIKALDPYHPVSLVMNCENYHFQQYTSGADIILTDVYPIGANTTWSIKFHTPVNTTYGCAGCDNCHGIDALPNLPGRLSTYRTYSSQLGLGTGLQKPLWAVPQAFGPEDHWARHPTADEEAAMVMLNVNHGVKGSVAWAWPPADEIQAVSTKLAKALTDTPVTGLLLGAKMVKLSDCGTDEGKVDATAWVAEDGRGGMLVGWVNPGRAVLDVKRIDLAPALLEGAINAMGVKSVVWGSGDWTLSQSRWLVQKTGGAGLAPLEVNMLILDVTAAANADTAPPGIMPATGSAFAEEGGSGVTS